MVFEGCCVVVFQGVLWWSVGSGISVKLWSAIGNCVVVLYDSCGMVLGAVVRYGSLLCYVIVWRCMV